MTTVILLVKSLTDEKRRLMIMKLCFSELGTFLSVSYVTSHTYFYVSYSLNEVYGFWLYIINGSSISLLGDAKSWKIVV